MKKLIACLLGAAVAVSAAAITPKEEIKENPQKAGGVYYAYPGPAEKLTPAPKGFEPF